MAIPGEAMALRAEEVLTHARAAGFQAHAVDSLASAVRVALSTSAAEATTSGLSSPPLRLVVCGSLYLAGHALTVNGGDLSSDSRSPPACPTVRVPPPPPEVAAFIALGSNLGHRARHLSRALTELRACGRVVRVSPLYVTAPQHVVEQPDFLNAACELHTRLPATELLLRLKAIERRLGRSVGGIRYGPRKVDLDIVLYGTHSVETTTAVGPLSIPHRLMLERTFVLKPLCDLAPGFRHPAHAAPLAQEYARLCAKEAAAAAAAGGAPQLPTRVLAMREDVTWELGQRTYVMGILNITPDSFSDGGHHDSLGAALCAARAMAEAGADVIDIGAESTRPGAPRVTEEEELRRLLPVIERIRAQPDAWAQTVLLSVDTTRASVAAAAVRAGADMINDISGGTFDVAMYRTCAALQVPYALMHTRGLPAEMMARATYDDLVGDVCHELSRCLRAAQAAGLPPWLLIADPGIGFAKQMPHNLEMLHELPRFVAHFTSGAEGLAAATLVGASRKGFIGKVLGQPDPLQRQWGNAATVSASVVGGADIVRVHEVDEMRQVARVSDAVHRQRQSGGPHAAESPKRYPPPQGETATGARVASECTESAATGDPTRRCDAIELGDISFECIVGIREREQRALQPLVVDLCMEPRETIEHCAHSGDLDRSINYAAITKQVVFIGQHGQWGLLESFATALCRLLLLEPAPGEGRATVQTTDVRVRKPKALGGAAVPAIHMRRDCTWTMPAPVALSAGATIALLEEAPTTGAYRLLLEASATYSLPVDAAAFVVCGGVSASDGTQLGRGDTLAKGAMVRLVAGGGGAALLLVGRSLRLFPLGVADDHPPRFDGTTAVMTATTPSDAPERSAAAKATAPSDDATRSAAAVGRGPSEPRAPRILLLDNYDSYTHNLCHLIALTSGRLPITIACDAYDSWAKLMAALPPIDAVVVSPGPGTASRASDFGICREAYTSGLPVLGVCLGHQGLALAFGGDVRRGEPMHGLISQIVHGGDGLFAGVPSPFPATRYHSLHVWPNTLPAALRATAHAADDGVIMALEHRTLPLFGVQFHPESISSEHGRALITNFLQRVSAHAGVEWMPSRIVEAEHFARSICRPPASTPWANRRLAVMQIDPQIAANVSAEQAFSSLFAAAPLSFWIDAEAPSPVAPAGAARFSYMGCGGGPHSYLLRQTREGRVERIDAARGTTVYGAQGLADARSDLLSIIRGGLAEWEGALPSKWQPSQDGGGPTPHATLTRAPLTDELAFRGGFVGLIGYEAWRWLGPTGSATELRDLPKRAVPPASTAGGDAGDGAHPANDEGTPADGIADTTFLFADRLIAIDHTDQRIFLLCLCDGLLSHEASSRWFDRTSRALRTLSVGPPQVKSEQAGTADGPARFEFERGEGEYLEDINAIQRHLHAGESYEVCCTTQISCVSHAPPPLSLYTALRQINPAPHAAYLRIDPLRICASSDAIDGTAASGRDSPLVGAHSFGPGGVAVCCSSPERFLRVRADGQVECKPIKGTAPRGATEAEDVQLAEDLRRSAKERSENLMIVDLIRNDMSRVCEVGSVQVPSLMAIETFKSVHQLVSTVRGQLRPGFDALDAVAAAFPPGSMTGAPKVRTMRIIDEIERSSPRGAYSGALGFFSVHGGCDLNVVIRTATVSGGGVAIGAGGAIVAQSEPLKEWREVVLKATPVMRAVSLASCGDADAYTINTLPGAGRTRAPRTHGDFAEAHPAPARLFETLLHSPSEGFFLLPQHLQRLRSSASTLGFSYVPTETELCSQLEAHAATWQPEVASRVKLVLHADGTVGIEQAALRTPPTGHPRIGLQPDVLAKAELRSVRIDPFAISSSDMRLRHKSTRRDVYDAARMRAGAGRADTGIFDALLHNEAGELTECAIANIALEDEAGGWRTPPLDCGLLNGTMRAALLEACEIQEGVITLEDLRAALAAGRQLVGFNALRGVYRLRVEGLLEGQSKL